MSNRFVHADSAVATALDGGLVILNTSSNRYFKLNEVGAVVWSDIGDGLQQDEIVARVAERYATPQATVADDIERLVSQLLEAKLIANLR